MGTYLSEEQKQTVYAYFRPYFPKDCVMAVSPVHGDADYDWLTMDCGRQGIYDMSTAPA